MARFLSHVLVDVEADCVVVVVEVSDSVEVAVAEGKRRSVKKN